MERLVAKRVKSLRLATGAEHTGDYNFELRKKIVDILNETPNISLQQIGDKVGRTRERVRQLLVKLRIEKPRYIQPVKYITKNCTRCGNEFTIERKINRRLCHPHCMSFLPKPLSEYTIDEMRARGRHYAKRYNDRVRGTAKFKASTKRANKKQAERLRALKPEINRVCLHCDKAFTTKHKLIKHCSFKCSSTRRMLIRRAYARERYAQRKLLTS